MTLNSFRRLRLRVLPVVLAACCLGLSLGQAASTWRVLADARPNNGVWMASATEGWAVGTAGMITHTIDGGANWVEQASGVTGDLNDVWGADATHVWAVGDGGVILKYDGTSWAAQTSGVSANLQSVHGINATTMWAVGANATLLKGDGSAWAAQSITGPKNYVLNGVFVVNATNIWSVGDGGKILKGDGGAWSAQTNSNSQDLYGVWATSTTNIIAVGAAGTVRLSTNGTSWGNGPTTAATGILRSVTGTDSSHVWIAGDAGVIAFYNGSGNFVSSTSNTTQALNSIFAASSTAVVAVGERKAFNIFNGTDWTAKSSAIPSITYNSIWGSDDDNVWFAGSGGVISHYNGTTFNAPTTGVSVTFNAIWGADANNIWAVGASGTIMKWNGSAWAAQASGVGQTLNGVNGTSATDVWAVGNSGTILHFNGSVWAAVTSGSTQNLNAVWSVSASAVWAVGANGTILKYSGSAWAAQVSGVTQNLTGVSGSSATSIWSVGAGNVIVKSNGSTWALQTGGTAASFRSLVVVDATSQWATGGTTIIRGNGTAWADDGLTGFANPISSAWGSSVDTVFLAAANGMIFYNSPAAIPELTVEQPAGTALQSELSTVAFGNVVTPASVVKTITLKATGNTDLSNLNITKTGSADFTFTQVANPTLTTGSGGTTFDVTFTPSGDGPRAASLSITSNDLDEPVFTIPLTGTGQVPVTFTTQPVSKAVNLNTSATFTCVVNPAATQTITYQWQKYNSGAMAWEDITGVASAKTASYAITGATIANEGNYRCVATNPASPGGVPSNPVSLLINVEVAITAAPASVTVKSGSDVTLTVVATGTNPNYVWKRNGTAVIGAPNAPSYTMTGIQVAQGGDYTVTVSNPMNTVTSNPVTRVAVIDVNTKTVYFPTTGKAILTAAISGKPTDYTYVWKKGGSTFSAPRYTALNNVLTISSLQITPTTDADTYTCEITGPGGGSAKATFTLVVYSLPPVITGADPLIMATGMVGDPTYDFQIPFDSDPLKSPISFTVSTLPAGLVYNKNTGRITGRPMVALTADKTYDITLTAANAKLPNCVRKAKLTIKALPAASVGVFTGPIERQLDMNKNLGGKFDLTTTTAGAVSGKLTMGATAYSYTGLLISDVTGTNPPHATLTVKRTTGLTSLTVTCKMDLASFSLTECDITDTTHHAGFSAWLKRWGTVMSLADSNDLKTYIGYYTFGIDSPVPVVVSPVTPSEVHPQGLGYGSFTISSAGACTAAGKLADGTAFTSASYCGTHGEVLVFQCLYTNLGSLLGTLDIAQGTPDYVPPYGDNVLGGTLSWLRPQMLGTNHVYRAGFGPIGTTAVGGRYVPPATGTLLFGVHDDTLTPNATLAFTDGGIAGTSTDSLGTKINPGLDAQSNPVAVRIKAGGVFVPAHSTTLSPDPNPCSTSLTLAPGTGLFSGTATLLDLNPAVVGGKITRTLNYSGIVFRDVDTQYRGWGYFVLARRPDLSTQTVLTTDVLSGIVELQKK